MQRLKQLLKNTLIIVVAAFQVMFPAVLYAQETDPTVTDSTVSTTETVEPATESPTNTDTTNANPPDVQGPTEPTGADGDTYEYNPETGLWENDYYTWDPVTKQTKPKTTQSYSYNPETGYWDTTEWYYSPETGTYQPNTVTVTQAPAEATITNTGPGSDNSITTDEPLAVASIDQTGPDSSNTILIDSGGSGFFDLFFDASITHNVSSEAHSGDAAVLQNTLAGDATSGDAMAISNILNMLQSTWGMLGSDTLIFNSDINGDVLGDILFDPGQLNQQLGVGGQNYLENLEVNAAIDGQINNNIDLVATSGDATVAGNTEAGSATSGTATAMANVINMINSIIAAGDSFIGNINIYGSLEGDILLPSWLQNQLLASNTPTVSFNPLTGTIDNTGPDSTNTIDQSGGSNLSADLSTSNVINNAINATATTGDATVAHNTAAGDATSGDASTNITLFNMTGREIVGSNSLIVFVNVLGEWVGLIMDAPEGTTAATIGSGITQNGSLPSNTDLDITTNSEINNNINVTAVSGDATVYGNTRAGNATSGDATAGVNALNLVNSSFALSDWFGILFINVFGNWYGSFGVDTPMGDSPAAGSGGGSQTPSNQQPQVASASSGNIPKVFGFSPGAGNTNSGNGGGTTEQVAAVSDTSGSNSSNTQTKTRAEEGTLDIAENAAGTPIWIFATLGLAAILIFGWERIISFFRPRV